MTPAPKIVLSGGIGSGKSTAVRAAMQRLGWEAPAGFFTHWAGADRGAETLYIETWAGARQVMARRAGAAWQLEPGFVPAAAASLAAAGRPVVIDELGAIELAAPEFAAAVARLFRGPAPVLAVIQRRALADWLKIIGAEHVTHRCEVTPETRAGLPAQIAAWFGA